MSTKPKDHLEYPRLTMFQMIKEMEKKYSKDATYEFYGSKTSYKRFVEKIERAARAFLAMGIGQGDRVTICLPNIPQALDCFYALNRIGAVANMVHPLSARDEITFYLTISKSKAILTTDMFYEKVEESLEKVPQDVTVLVARIQDELNPILKVAYTAKSGLPYLKYPNTDHAMLWSKFLKKGKKEIPLPEITFDEKRTAVILYSGGTSGVPKGICLTDLNFNACGLQAKEALQQELTKGLTMLSCMPCFHGFGLGINLHAVFIHGATCILMPTFTSQSYAKMLAKKKPNYIAGVPTIFEALLHLDALNGVDLSCLKGMFCGGDSLSIELKKKVDAFLKDHNASIQIREGYGLTECVTASCLTPKDSYREGSIGLPFPDTLYAIVRPGTDEVLPYGEEGEIILTGPTVMLGYLDNPEETAQTLRVMPDGRTWLYTGDLGRMDEDGYVYYRQRIKRMIITNGYNVYPGQLENVLDSCPDVSYSCVIGVNDPRRMKRIKAYIVLKDGVTPDDACKERIMARVKDSVARYAWPKEIEFRKELPKTLVGKVAYRLLEEEANKEAESKGASHE
ncbi:MAG: class I adenylate-forming enzyme family protein [Eubacteriales bacterium]|nr:class I adenylate-forming enzyme family protein [Eubacteriales bacterium]